MSWLFCQAALTYFVINRHVTNSDCRVNSSFTSKLRMHVNDGEVVKFILCKLSSHVSAARRSCVSCV